MFLFSRVLYLDLLPSDSFTPTLHLVAYSVNQKGRSEPTVLEDIAINEAEKRTGMNISFHSRRGNLFFFGCYGKLSGSCFRSCSHHTIHKFGCLEHCMRTLSIHKFIWRCFLSYDLKTSHVSSARDRHRCDVDSTFGKR